MASTEPVVGEEPTEVELNGKLRNGSVLMALAGIAFIGYGVVFLVLQWSLSLFTGGQV